MSEGHRFPTAWRRGKGERATKNYREYRGWRRRRWHRGCTGRGGRAIETLQVGTKFHQAAPAAPIETPYYPIRVCRENESVSRSVHCLIVQMTDRYDPSGGHPPSGCSDHCAVT